MGRIDRERAQAVAAVHREFDRFVKGTLIYEGFALATQALGCKKFPPLSHLVWKAEEQTPAGYALAACICAGLALHFIYGGKEYRHRV